MSFKVLKSEIFYSVLGKGMMPKSTTKSRDLVPWEQSRMVFKKYIFIYWSEWERKREI